MLVPLVFWFDVPFRGSPWLFAWLSLLFIVSGLGMGLLISTIAQTQKQAQQLTIVLVLLGMMLTGLFYPRSTMPPAVRAAGNLIPVTYFIRIARGIITKGAGDTIDITPAVGYCDFDVEVPNSYAALPPTKQTKTIKVRVESTQQTNLVIGSATLDGATPNYVKLVYTETDGSSRDRAK